MKFCAPGYIWPTLGEWDILISTLTKGDIVVCNVNSGPGRDPNTMSEFEKDIHLAWKKRIMQIADRNAVSVGYVDVARFTGKSYIQIRDEMIQWILWYGVDGFWFDDMITNENGVSFYTLQGLHGLARSLNLDKTGGYPKGLSIWNPGAGDAVTSNLSAAIPQEWLNRLPGSLWCTYEGTGADYLAELPKPKSATAAQREIHLVHTVKLEEIQAIKNHAWASGVGYGSMTADGGDNPYDTAASPLG